MDSVIVRKLEDFEHVDSDTSEIEFVSYSDVFTLGKELNLKSLTFTKMDVFLDFLPDGIERLGLYDCTTDLLEIKRFSKLKRLEITNCTVDILNLMELTGLESLSLNYCEIINWEKLNQFSNLSFLSLVEVIGVDYNFLLNNKSIQNLIIDDVTFEENRNLFLELSKRGVLITDMFGGEFL